MFVAQYRRTEQGALKRMADQIAAERAGRLAAQREAFLAAQEAALLREQNAKAKAERLRRWKDELRAQGFEYRPSVREIELRACRAFDVTPAEIRSNRRSRKIVFARQFVMYWACRITHLSLPQIGRLIGGRDHTTVLHGKSAYVEKRAAMGRHLRPAR